MEQLQLDWSTAEVSDGTLTVGLSRKPPKRWRDACERTATLLGAGSWELALNAKNASVRVPSVQPGDEERVRQFLEGVVLEANTTLVGQHKLFEGPPIGDEPAEDDDADADAPEPPRDEELAGRFRDFARDQGNDDG